MSETTPSDTPRAARTITERRIRLPYLQEPLRLVVVGATDGARLSVETAVGAVWEFFERDDEEFADYARQHAPYESVLAEFFGPGTAAYSWLDPGVPSWRLLFWLYQPPGVLGSPGNLPVIVLDADGSVWYPKPEPRRDTAAAEEQDGAHNG
jgi:hypothetical protein